MDIRKLFWGFELSTTWPDLPDDGRIIDPDSRHATVAFLGETDLDILKPFLENFKLPVELVLAGYINHLIFLPNKRRHRVVSLSGVVYQHDVCLSIVNSIKNGMKDFNIKLDDRDWLFHVTIARSPLRLAEWEKIKICMPFYLKGVHLYQSFPGLVYEKIHSYLFLPAYEEMEHTSDIRFKVKGKSYSDLYLNVLNILTNFDNNFSSVLNKNIEVSIPHPRNIDEAHELLNNAISYVDRKKGTKIKALTSAGDFNKYENHYEWEIIIDV